MSNNYKLWLRLPVALQHIDGLSKDGAYRAIRRGTFPFRTEVIAGRIYVSARDLGLIPPNESENGKASKQDESLAATA